MSEKKSNKDHEIKQLESELNSINSESDLILKKRKLKKEIKNAKLQKFLIKLGLKNKRENGK